MLAKIIGWVGKVFFEESGYKKALNDRLDALKEVSETTNRLLLMIFEVLRK